MRLIDETDREILRILRADARTSVTTIAATLKITRATAAARIAALQNDGVILRFTVDTDHAVDGDPIESISLIACSSQRIQQVQKAIQRVLGVSSLYSTNGKWDLVAHTHSSDLAEFDKTLNQFSQIPGVVKLETCLLLTRLA